MPSPEVSTSEPSHTAFPAPQSTDLLAKQVVDLSMQIQAQEMLFALLVQALHPIVDRQRLADARRIIETPDAHDQDPLRSAIVAALERLDEYLGIAEEAKP